MHRKRILTLFFTGGILALLLSFLFFSGCTTVPGTQETQTLLFLFSSYTGNVYSFDPEQQTCSSLLFDYENSAGDYVYFYNCSGYISANPYGGTGQFLCFDPDDSTPAVTEFTHSWTSGPSAAAFVSTTKGYVGDAGTYAADFPYDPEEDGGVYVFDPSDTGAMMTKVTDSDSNVQGMAYVGLVNKLYIANNNAGTDTVSVIDTATDTETSEITVSENPWNVVPLGDGSKVYVLSPNYYGESTLTEIDTSSDTVTDTFPVCSGAQGASIYGTKIYYTGGYYDDDWVWHDTGPYYIDVAEETPVETAITTTEVGGGQTLVHAGRLYVSKPSGTLSTLTVVDLSDYTEVEGSPFDVGGDGDGIKGMAVY
jgi:YVTN family beta-propeller protein